MKKQTKTKKEKSQRDKYIDFLNILVEIEMESRQLFSEAMSICIHNAWEIGMADLKFLDEKKK